MGVAFSQLSFMFRDYYVPYPPTYEEFQYTRDFDGTRFQEIVIPYSYTERPFLDL
jgi:hypothetical protein